MATKNRVGCKWMWEGGRERRLWSERASITITSTVTGQYRSHSGILPHHETQFAFAIFEYSPGFSASNYTTVYAKQIWKKFSVYVELCTKEIPIDRLKNKWIHCERCRIGMQHHWNWLDVEVFPQFSSSISSNYRFCVLFHTQNTYLTGIY